MNRPVLVLVVVLEDKPHPIEDKDEHDDEDATAADGEPPFVLRMHWTMNRSARRVRGPGLHSVGPVPSPSWEGSGWVGSWSGCAYEIGASS
jgi:hypothetical protein